MATVDLTTGGTTGHPSRRQKRTPYMVREKITGAQAAAAKGSALATGDVLQVLDLPAESYVLAAGMEVLVGDSGTAASGTVQVGATAFTTSKSLTTTGYATPADGVNANATVDTVDVVLGTITAGGDDWEAEVFALILDVSTYPVVQPAKDESFID